jgi:hypothetical protein
MKIEISPLPIWLRGAGIPSAGRTFTLADYESQVFVYAKKNKKVSH